MCSRNAGLCSSRRQAAWRWWWQRSVWAGRSLRPGLTCQKIRLQRQLLCIRKMTLTRGLFSNRAEQLVHYSAFRGSQSELPSLCLFALSPQTSTTTGQGHVLWESQNVAQYSSHGLTAPERREPQNQSWYFSCGIETVLVVVMRRWMSQENSIAAVFASMHDQPRLSKEEGTMWQ